MPRRPTLTDAITTAALAFADAIHGHRDTQYHRIETTLNRMEAHMSRFSDDLADLRTAIAERLDSEVADLRTQLADAQSDDADVAANLSGLEQLSTGLRDGSFPAAPVTPEDPAADTTGDTTDPGVGTDVPPVDGTDTTAPSTDVA